MASSLPAEMLAHILSLAQEGQSVPERLQTRLTFEKVCRTWYKCDNKWRIIAVNGVDNVRKLARTLNAMSPRTPTAGPGAAIAVRIRTLHLTLPSGTDGAGVCWISALLKKLTDVESLEIVQEERSGGVSCFNQDVVAALASITNVKHFAIGMAPRGPLGKVRPTLAFKLNEFGPKWTKLESITYTNCALPTNDLGLCSIATGTFRLLILDQTVLIKPESNVRSVNTDKPRAQPQRPLPKQLTTIRVIDAPLTQERVQFEGFITNFTHLQHLAIDSSALKNMGHLAYFTRLATLEIVQNSDGSDSNLSSVELMNILTSARSLTRLSLSVEMSEAWEAHELVAVRGALPRGAQLLSI